MRDNAAPTSTAGRHPAHGRHADEYNHATRRQVLCGRVVHEGDPCLLGARRPSPVMLDSPLLVTPELAK